ncbi:hypothetical protein J2Z21_008881 [Streptomyces griseochromogenes]|uniref:Uncharacterized protein n=1 Tax=Streptomyces griseochromogenes TaxID=68214 RepID=A0A1B1AZK6_9ACTN|nr:hypothetical protein [Streptomyces griseochromogenes]ANP52013.1 hypothetical protein AVL59_22715 [Streptomyces griseochromogenes]MBP2055865.1 hypothetical protein [Streptomyces griseochromogenes]
MRLVGAAVRRIWTVELRPRPGGPTLACIRCTAHTLPLQAESARSAALAHLASHARADALPTHLRTCQCRAQGCLWHPRHRGCAGPVLLALTRDHSGRAWRLADACAACAAATGNTAVVPDTLLSSPRSPTSDPTAVRRVPGPGADEYLRVREMLTYLATALPRCTSPAARLLALQLALRANAHGLVRLPAGLLRSMRLRGRTEIWEELAHGFWLRPPDLRPTPVEVQLLDAAVRDQAPGRGARRRAAHWALRPRPLALHTAAPPAVQLVALVLAAHPSPCSTHTVDMGVLARLCGHSPHQTAELLDRLVATRTLARWRHERDIDEVVWNLYGQRP